MILVTDVHYENRSAVAAGIMFHDWSSLDSIHEYTSRILNVADYTPGQFYKRELPCIMQMLDEHSLTPDLIIIDGYVYLDGKEKPGLGKHLFEVLGGETPIIGIAKSRFEGIGAKYAVYRGHSQSPLFVTSVGMALEAAKRNFQSMHGDHRLPTLLKRVDRLARDTV